MNWYFWVGILAAICIAIYFIPQLIKVFKTKDTSGLSLAMLILMTSGDLLFIITSIGMCTSGSDGLSGGLPVLLANLIAVITSGILLFFKVRALHYAKQFKTTEKEFCENYQAYKTKIKMAKAEKEAAKNVIVPPDEKPSQPQQPSSGNPTQAIG